MSDIVAIGLESPNTLTAAPYTFGHAFKEGDVPAGQSVVGTGASFQCIPKVYWDDGSLKTAIISGRADITGGAVTNIMLSHGAPAGGTPIGTGAVSTAALTVAFDGGVFGSASWSGADWVTPFETIASGPVMSSWKYRKPFSADSHLVAWLELRCYTSGHIEILPHIENGYLNFPGPINKVGTFTLAIGGVEKFNQALDVKSHTRTPLINGTNLSYWHGVADPLVTPKHDQGYLASTRLVPSYLRRAAITGTGSLFADLPATFAPFQQGSFRSVMGAAGGTQAISIITGQDSLYVNSDNQRDAYTAIVRNGFSAGRYGTHFRDETTNHPLILSQYPNLVMGSGSGLSDVGVSSKNQRTPSATGGSNATFSVSHHPSIAFMAALLSGWHYFVEELQFVATAIALKQTDTVRKFGDGVIVTNAGANQTRGAAWGIRTLSQAAAISPDSDAITTELRAQFEANINFYHAKYIAQANNPLGFVHPYTNYGPLTGTFQASVWQSDFVTAAWGYAKAIKPNMSSESSAKLTAFFEWKAKSIVGRLGGTGATEWPYWKAAEYTVTIAPTATPDYNGGTGPWYGTFAELLIATTGSGNGGVAEPISGHNWPESTSYWANLVPAIAYAVQHGVAGAADAWNRLITATGWTAQEDSFVTGPAYGIAPASIVTVAPLPVDPTPTPITAADIKLRKAGTGLGGAISATDAGVSIFGSGTKSGDVEYRCIYVLNNHPTKTYTGVKIWISANTVSASSDIAMGAGTSVAGGVEQEITTALTEPLGINFKPAESSASGVSLGNLLPGGWQAVWLRLTTLASAPATAPDTPDTFTICIDGRFTA